LADRKRVFNPKVEKQKQNEENIFSAVLSMPVSRQFPGNGREAEGEWE
jgi:hypothetical protein